MNIASALLKQVLVLQDFETWSCIRQDYLPNEYHTLFKVVDKHCESFHALPSFEDLKFEIRDPSTLEKLHGGCFEVFELTFQAVFDQFPGEYPTENPEQKSGNECHCKQKR